MIDVLQFRSIFVSWTIDFPAISWSKLYDFMSRCFDNSVISELYGFSLAKMLREFLNINFYASIITGGSWKS